MYFRKFAVSIFFLFMAMATIAQDSNPQENNSKIFVKIIGGYAFMGPGSYTESNRTSGGKFEENKNKFGEGYRVGAGVGFILNENINIGLDVVYHKGLDLDITQTIENQRDSIGNSYIRTTNQDITTTYTNTILNFIPNITFKAISKPTYYVYNRVGIIIALPLELGTTTKGFTSYQTKNTPIAPPYDYSNNYTYDYDGYYSQDPAFGFQAALGVQFILTEKLRFFTEIEASSLVLNPKELVYDPYVYTSTTVRTVPGPPATISSSVDERPRQYFYQKSGVLKTDNGTDQVTIYTSQKKIPANSLSLNIGLALRL